MIKAIIKILVGFLLFLFIGIKYDTEFYQAEFFIKHKPNLKVEYYSTIGESDFTLNDLRGNRKEQEMAYKEFVGNYYDSDFLDKLSFFIIPLMSLFFLSGIAQLLGIINRKNELINLGLGYLSNLILLFILFTIYWTLGIPGLFIIIGYWIFSALSIVLISRKLNRTIM